MGRLSYLVVGEQCNSARSDVEMQDDPQRGTVPAVLTSVTQVAGT